MLCKYRTTKYGMLTKPSKWEFLDVKGQVLIKSECFEGEMYIFPISDTVTEYTRPSVGRLQITRRVQITGAVIHTERETGHLRNRKCFEADQSACQLHVVKRKYQYKSTAQLHTKTQAKRTGFESAAATQLSQLAKELRKAFLHHGFDLKKKHAFSFHLLFHYHNNNKPAVWITKFIHYVTGQRWSCPCCLTKHHAIMTYGGVKVQIHAFLAFALDISG
jgi:hypothetical protein